jgi:uncharacterized short protein YbdD (DUF466 family)
MSDSGRAAVVRFLKRMRETAHLMVGLPDYARYLEHRRVRHAGDPVMTRAEFVRERTVRRFEGRGVGRCC